MIRVYAEDFVKTAGECEQIVCFGTGKIFSEAREFLEKNGLLNKVRYCIDNNPDKQGREIEMGDGRAQILSLEEYEKRCKGNEFLLITCARIEEVTAQLEQTVNCSKLQYACYNVIANVMAEMDAMKKQLPEKTALSDVPLIPKKIHYCWFGGNPIPDRYKKWMESWHKLCPDYEIIEWNESNYDIGKNEYMRQAYEHRKWGFVPDYARLDIIYNYGGIYLDTDVELIANMDDMLYQKGFVGFESRKYVNLGLGFGAVKHHKMIKAFLESYEGLSFVNEDGSLNMTASPVYQTEALKKYGLENNGEYQIINDITVFPEKMFSGKSLSTRRIKLAAYSKSIHHYDGSWLPEEEKAHAEFCRKYISEELGE